MNTVFCACRRPRAARKVACWPTANTAGPKSHLVRSPPLGYPSLHEPGGRRPPYHPKRRLQFPATVPARFGMPGRLEGAGGSVERWGPLFGESACDRLPEALARGDAADPTGAPGLASVARSGGATPSRAARLGQGCGSVHQQDLKVLWPHAAEPGALPRRVSRSAPPQWP